MTDMAVVLPWGFVIDGSVLVIVNMNLLLGSVILLTKEKKQWLSNYSIRRVLMLFLNGDFFKE